MKRWLIINSLGFYCGEFKTKREALVKAKKLNKLMNHWSFNKVTYAVKKKEGAR